MKTCCTWPPTQPKSIRYAKEPTNPAVISISDERRQHAACKRNCAARAISQAARERKNKPSRVKLHATYLHFNNRHWIDWRIAALQHT